MAKWAELALRDITSEAGPDTGPGVFTWGPDQENNLCLYRNGKMVHQVRKSKLPFLIRQAADLLTK